MFTIRKADTRGQTRIDWLDSRHTFSFGGYVDPAHMGFGALRVINDDRVAPGEGFGEHGHRDMEILTYVLDGQLQHRDSLGNGSVLEPGDVQVMSAGSGIRHSEFNPSKTNPVHFLQIWILPRNRAIPPRYQDKRFPNIRSGRWVTIASPDGQEGSLPIDQDARVMVGTFNNGSQPESFTVAEGRKAYLHVARGTVTVNGQALDGGDGVEVTGAEQLNFAKADDAELLLFDLA